MYSRARGTALFRTALATTGRTARVALSAAVTVARASAWNRGTYTAELRANPAPAVAFNATLYLRYRAGAGRWINLPSQTLSVAGASVSYSANLIGLEESTTYTVQAATSSNFAGAASGQFDTPAIPPPTLSLSSFSAPGGAVGSRTALVTFSVTALGPVTAAGLNATVYLRLRREGSSTVIRQTVGTVALTNARRTRSGNWELSGLSPETAYEVDGSLSSGYVPARTVEFTTGRSDTGAGTGPGTGMGVTQDTPELVGFAHRNVNTNSADLRWTANQAAVTSPTAQVYCRYREVGTVSWQNAPGSPQVVNRAQRDFNLTGLDADTSYVAQASLSAAYPAGARLETDWRTDRVVDEGPDDDGPTRAAIITSLSTSALQRTSVTLVATIDGTIPSGQQVYLRWREGSGVWSDPSGQAATGRPEWDLSGLTPGVEYSAQVSLTADFSAPYPVPPYVFTTPSVVGPTGAPAVIGISDLSSTASQISFSVNVRDPNPARQVYARFRRVGDSAFTGLGGQAQRLSAPFTTTGVLVAGTQYELQGSLDSTFRDGTEVSRIWSTSGGPIVGGGEGSTGLVPYLQTPVFSDITLTSMRWTAYTEGQSSTYSQIYYRWRVAGTSVAWTDGTPAGRFTNKGTFSRSLTGLQPGTAYQVQISLSRTYGGGTQLTYNTIVSTLVDTEARIDAFSASNITTGGFTANLTINAPQGQTVYFRWRQAAGTTWVPLGAYPARASMTQALVGLPEESSLVVQASLTPGYGNARTLNITTPFTRPVASRIEGYSVSAPDASGNRSITFDVAVAPGRTSWFLRMTAVDQGAAPRLPQLTQTVGIAAGGTTRVTLSNLPAGRFGRAHRLTFTTRAQQTTGGEVVTGFAVTFTFPQGDWPQLTGLEVLRSRNTAIVARVTAENPANPLPGGGQLTLTADPTGPGGNVVVRQSYINAVNEITVSGLAAGSSGRLTAELYGFSLSAGYVTTDSRITFFAGTPFTRPPSTVRWSWTIENPQGAVFLRWREVTIQRTLGVFLGYTPVGDFTVPVRLLAGASGVYNATGLKPDAAYQGQLSLAPDFPADATRSEIVETHPSLVTSLGAITFDMLQPSAGTVRASVPVTNPLLPIWWRWKESTATEYGGAVPAQPAALVQVIIGGLERSKTYDVQAAVDAAFTAPVSAQIAIPSGVTVGSTVPPPTIERYRAGDILGMQDFNSKVEAIAHLRAKNPTPLNPNLIPLGRDDGAGRIVLPWNGGAGRREVRRYQPVTGQPTEDALLLFNAGELHLLGEGEEYDPAFLSDLAAALSLAGGLLSAGSTARRGGVEVEATAPPAGFPTALGWDGTALAWADILPTGVSYAYAARRADNRFAGTGPLTTENGGPVYTLTEMNVGPPHTFMDLPPFPLGGTVRVRVSDAGTVPRAIVCTKQDGSEVWRVDAAVNAATNRIVTVAEGDVWSLDITVGTFTTMGLTVSARIIARPTAIAGLP